MTKDISSREDIELVMNIFYNKIIDDQLISHFFTQVADFDLTTHMPIIVNFWESVVLGNMIYKGSPIQKHIELNRKSKLSKEHFDRWLEILNITIDNNFKGDNALKMKNSAYSIAVVMQTKLQS